MINYFFRSLRKDKLFSIINILGLTAGFYTAIVIYEYVSIELSYDAFQENSENIYRINQTFIWGDDQTVPFSRTGAGVSYAIQEEIPEVKQVARLLMGAGMGPIVFDQNGQELFFHEETIFGVDSTFLEIFTLPLKYGDKNTALDKSNSVVLSPATALKFFGDIDPVGKEITMDNGETFIVTGVTEELPGKSYLEEFDVLFSMTSIDRIKTSDWNWMWTMFETYVMIEDGVSIENLQEKLNALPEKHAVRTLDIMGYTYDEYIAAGKEWNLYLQPFQDIHLHSNGILASISRNGDFKTLVALIGSVVFLLILSCINFINLSTAKFTKKAKVLALHKVLGSSKQALQARFFFETIGYCLIAGVFAIFAVSQTVVVINQRLGTALSLDFLNQPGIWLFFLVLIITTAALSSLYPFLFFNSFDPAQALKGTLRSGAKASRIRNGMLMVQYVMSFLLLMISLTVYRQLDFFLNADLGFNEEQLIAIENMQWLPAQDQFAAEIGNLSSIEGAVNCTGLPMLIGGGDQFIPEGENQGSIPLNFVRAEEDYAELLGLNFLIGRSFDRSYAQDSAGVIINESALAAIGWELTDDVIGKKVKNWSGEYHILGVVSDFYFWSLHTPVEPFAIFSDKANVEGNQWMSRMLVKVAHSSTSTQEVMQQLESKWLEFAPNRPFEAIILNDRIKQNYEAEEQFGSIMGFFSLLTILIASLGLTGMIIFSLEGKIKEIGVRKVLGATASNLVTLFSKSYLLLLLGAFAIAVPLASWMMQLWLQDFENHISLSFDLFLIPLLIVFALSAAIAIYNVGRAFVMNPADVLHDE